MKIKRLVLKNFRNYSDLSWSPGEFINIISGKNAQGKTNLLEALFFCVNGRSFRTSKIKNIIGYNGTESYASAIINNNHSSIKLEVYLNSNSKTVFKVNGSKENKNNLCRYGYAVAFTPADLGLITGSPLERRKWIDFELGVLSIEYQHNLDKYEKVVAHRNNLLKTNGSNANIRALIEPWNEQLVYYGSNLIEARIGLLKEIFPYLREVVSNLTSGKEEITFNYISSLPLEKGMNKENISLLFKKTVDNCLNQEIYRQQTLYGPHRDDLIFFLNGINVKNFGSRGQQRTVILALKIAVMKMFYQEYNEYPILLLDDVFLELDQYRQKGLIEILADQSQVFITSEKSLEGYFNGKEDNYVVLDGKIYKGG